MVKQEGDRVWVSYGVTINVGNYESVKVDMGMSLELDKEDNELEVINEIYDSIKCEVLDKKLEILKERKG
jgi:hypothetical protein